jgi:hypothetical protein
VRAQSLPPFFAAVLATTLPVAAQSIRTLSWPTTFAAGSFAAAASGDFTGDQRRSCVVVRNALPFFVYDPAVYTAISQIPGFGGVTGVERFPPDPGHAPTRDRILLAHAGGLGLCTCEADGTFTTAAMFGAAWGGTVHLSMRRDLVGDAAVAGLASDGLSLRLANGPAGGPWTSVTGIALPEPLTDVLLLDWDQDDAMDAVGIGASTLYPFHLDGTPLPPVATGAAILAADVWTGTGTEMRIALLQQIAGLPVLVVRDALTTDYPVELDGSGLGAPPATHFDSITALDFDDDGDDDVVLTHAGTAKLLALRAYERPEVPEPFGVTSTQYVWSMPTDNQLVGYAVAPIADDFDRDGEVDFALLHEDAPALHMVLTPPMPGFPVYGTENAVLQAQLGMGDLVLGLSPEFAESYAAFEVVVWHQGNPLAGPSPLDPQALFCDVVAPNPTQVPGANPDDLVVELTLDDEDLALCGLTIWPGHDHLWIEVRGISEADAYGPSVVAGLT